MFDISKLVSGGLLKLYNEIDDTTVEPVVELYPASALKYQVDNDPSHDVLLTELVVCGSANKVNEDTFELLSEGFWLTGGTEVTKPDGTDVVQFAGTPVTNPNIRGLYNIHGANPPTAASGGSRNYKEHKQNAIFTIPEDYLIRYLHSLWEASTSVEPCELGEDMGDVGQVISLHTDGKFYKYHNVNYPDAQGMLNEVGTAGQTKTYTNLRGLFVGLTGLTANDYFYAENGVKYTQTPSATTKLIGKTKGTTAVLLDIAVPGTPPASQAQAEGGLVQGVYMDPLRTKQAIDYNLTSVQNLFGTGSDGDVTLAAGTTTLVSGTIKNYNNLTIPNGATLASTAGGKSAVIIKVKGNLTIDAGGAINLNGCGALGGASVSISTDSGAAKYNEKFDGNDGADGTSTYETISDVASQTGKHGHGNHATNSNDIVAAGSGGGGCAGLSSPSVSSAASASIGGASTTAAACAASDSVISTDVIYKNPFFALMGGGGASGGAAGNAQVGKTLATSGKGGNGGGIIFLFVKGTVTVNGTISANGEAGGNATSSYSDVGSWSAAVGAGGGGGGCGGTVILLYAGTISSTIRSSVTVNGGAAGNGSSTGVDGVTGNAAWNHSNGVAGSAGTMVIQKVIL